MSVTKMTINLQMDNAAFDPDKWEEVARILQGIAARISKDNLPYVLIDINGQSVGTIIYDEVTT